MTMYSLDKLTIKTYEDNPHAHITSRTLGTTAHVLTIARLLDKDCVIDNVHDIDTKKTFRIKFFSYAEVTMLKSLCT